MARITTHSNESSALPAKTGGSGISAKYRVLLSELHRVAGGPFTVDDAIRILKLPRKKVGKLLPYFAKSGWLKRVKRGLYLPVPLEAKSPALWTDNDWVIAVKMFDPCYIGGWSSALHFGFTDQLFTSVVVCTTKRVRNREIKTGEFSFVIRTVRKNRFFGLTPVWRGRTKMMISDPSRTVVDILNSPLLGGGIRHVADILTAYFSSEHRNDAKIMEYGTIFGNRTLWKRLGYLIETLGFDAVELLEYCKREKGRSIAYLDPDLPHKGKNDKRWGLVINAILDESS